MAFPAVSKLESPEVRAPNPVVRAPIAVIVALTSSLFLLFMLGPIVGLVSAGGARGVATLGSDRDLRAALLLTVATATLATLLGVVGATPLAYLLARRSFRGRA